MRDQVRWATISWSLTLIGTTLVGVFLIGTTLGGGILRGTTIGGSVTTLGIGEIVGSGLAPLGSRKENLRSTEESGGYCGVGAGDGGCVGGADDDVGGSMGDLGI